MDSQTRQRLLELVYDLLPAAEAAELRRQVAADEEMARGYSEAQAAAKLLAEAARLPGPKIALQRPEAVDEAEEPVSASPGLSPPQAAVKTGGPSGIPWARWATWAVGLAAAVLLMLSVGSYWWHRQKLDEIAAEHLRVVVTGPATLHAGVAARYTVGTSAITGDPMPAEIELALYSPDGKQLHDHKERSGRDGRLEVTIPPDVDVPSGAKLEVVAASGDKQERVDTRLAVEPVGYVTHLALDKPLYQPGETIYYRSLTLSRFGLAADRQAPIHFEIRDPSGAVVPGSQLAGVTEDGVGNGEFPIPGELAGGEYVLVAQSLDDAFPEEKRPFFIRRYRLPRLKKELEFTRDSYAPGDAVVADFLAQRREGGAAAGAQLQITATVDGQPAFEKKVRADQSGGFQVEFELPKKIERGDAQLAVVVDDGGTRETIAKTIPINLGKVEVTFYPEGGDLVAGLENRVYFTSRDPLGEPVHVEGKIVDGPGNDVAAVETTHEGMGLFNFTPRPNRQYRLKIATPAHVTDEPKLPSLSTQQKVVLNTGVGVFEAGKPLEFNVRAAEGRLPLVVAAFCRGVPVGQQALVTTIDKDKDSGANPVEIPLADSIGGVIRLTVYDYSASPPKPVAERLVYRRMGQRLEVSTAGHSERYSPGEPVKMSLIVTNEKGEPVPAVLGVAVVDDALLSLADDDTPSMNTHLLLTTEVEKPEDLEEADFYLSDDPKAEAALDLLLGTQGWRRFAEKSLEELKEEDRQDEQLTRLAALGGPSNPPAMFDNLREIQSSYQKDLAAYQAGRDRTLDTLTTLSLFGVLGLWLLVVMLGLLKVVSGVHFWVPAVVVTICCLVIGLILTDPAGVHAGPTIAVAFAPFNVEPPDAKQATETGGQLAIKSQPLTGARAYEYGLMWERLPALDHALRFAGDRAEKGMDVKAPRGELLADMAEGDRYFDRFAPMDPAALGRYRVGHLAAGKDLGQLATLYRSLGKADMPAGDFRYRLGGDVSREEAVRLLAEELKRHRFVVRQYAHTHVPGPPGVRTDFAETLFWNPKLLAGPDGRAEISFDLSDSVTTFRVRADAHGDGRIGSGDGEVVSRIPFNLDPKLPLEVNAGDRIDLPLAVVNDTKDELPVELRIEHGGLVELAGDPDRKLELPAAARGREYFTLNVTGQKGDCELTFAGTAGRLADAVKRPLSVVPPGFPRSFSHSGKIDGPQQVVVDLPNWVPGSLEVTLNAFPSMLADLEKGMEGILREPTGCFEQASTSNYPNVLTMQYMQEHDIANPAAIRRAKGLLKKGYVKLVGYECKQKGYEWFGGDPGHEALTAYGLMEFRDMAEVYDVDQQMIDRTARWLMDQRDGKGGFKRNAKALDSFGRAPEEITNAYITWALSRSGQAGIEAEVKHVAQLAAASDDPYLIALAAGSALSAGRKDEAEPLLDKLAEAQADDGHLEGKQGSITRSGGQSLKVETTALAALAWLKLPAFAGQANRAIEWIIKSRQGSGGFGSTQATILALKALVEHSKANRGEIAAGKLIIRRDDLQIGEHAFEAGSQETIVVDGLEASLRPGRNQLTLNLTGENKMPYALDVAFRTLKPASDENCPLRLTTKLDKEKVKAGETVALRAELTNTSQQDGQPMTIAILGLPAGLEVRPDQLEELKKAKTIDYYETRAREVICYWRSLAPQKKVAMKLGLVAAVPGKYTGPASRTYLYYTSEQKQWVDPLRVEITRD